MNAIKSMVLSSALSVLCAQISVSASVDVNNLSENETFSFKITAVNAEEMPGIDLSPILNNFAIISGPFQQTNIQWINGKMTSSRSITWTLMARRTGNLIIPALDVKIGNGVFRTNPISMLVDKKESILKGSSVFIEIQIDKEQAYTGEQVTVTYKLYTNVSLTIDDIKFPQSVGFWTENLRVAQTIRFRDIKFQGKPFKVATLYKAALFPTRTGRLSIDPVIVIANIEIQRQRRPGNIFNDPFFNNMFRETQKKYIQSDSAWIIVEDFPPGEPHNYKGAVGEFKLNTSLDTAFTKINEAVTFHMEISGTGNLNLFNIPELDFPDYIEVFPPTITFKKDEFRDQITGVISADYILIPRSDGLFQLPRIELPYFNTVKGEWETVRSRPVLLTVDPNAAMALQTNFQKQEIEILGRDIHYIRNNEQNWKWNGNRTLTLLTWTAYILSASFFIVPGFLIKTQQNWIGGKKKRSSKQALRNAIKLLKQDKGDPFGEVTLVLFRFVKEKLFLDSENLDPASLKSELDNKISDELIEELVDIIKICDAGRFGPEGVSAEISIKKEAREIMKKINTELK